MPTDAVDEVADFLAAYPAPVPAVAAALRDLIREALPGAREMLDRPARVVGYGFGDGYADLICTLIPSKTGVKLGVARGAEMSDPDGLLEGAGKRHRHVVVRSASDPDPAAIARLLRTALGNWRARRG